MRRSLTRLWPAMMLLGCFGSHGPDDVTDSDGGRSSDCPPLGGMPTCGDRCEDRCPPDLSCDFSIGVCAPNDEYVRLTREGTDDTGAGAMVYCLSGRLGVTGTEPNGSGWFEGSCVDQAVCDELLREGGDRVCRYSDRTPYEAGPPAECPSDVPNEFSHYCGPGCGGCEEFPDPFYMTATSCIGVNEERGFGLCVFGSAHVCRRSVEERERFELLEGLSDMAYGRVVCMTQRLADGSWPDWGWFAFESGCRGYRSEFPDAIDCVDDDWRSIE